MNKNITIAMDNSKKYKNLPKICYIAKNIYVNKK